MSPDLSKHSQSLDTDSVQQGQYGLLWNTELKREKKKLAKKSKSATIFG